MVLRVFLADSDQILLAELSKSLGVNPSPLSDSNGRKLVASNESTKGLLSYLKEFSHFLIRQ